MALAKMTFTDAEVDAAARVLDFYGRFHHWWPERIAPYDALDPIAKSEFGGIVESMLRAAAEVRATSQPTKRKAK